MDFGWFVENLHENWMFEIKVVVMVWGTWIWREIDVIPWVSWGDLMMVC